MFSSIRVELYDLELSLFLQTWVCMGVHGWCACIGPSMSIHWFMYGDACLVNLWGRLVCIDLQEGLEGA